MPPPFDPSHQWPPSFHARKNLVDGLGLSAALERLADEEGEQTDTDWDELDRKQLEGAERCVQYVPTKTMQKTTMTPGFLAGQLFSRLTISCMTRPGWAEVMAAIVRDAGSGVSWEGKEKKYSAKLN